MKEFEKRDDFKKVTSDPYVKEIYNRLAKRFKHEILWEKEKTGTIKDLTGRFSEHGFFIHPLDSASINLGARDRAGTFETENISDSDHPSSIFSSLRADHQLAVRQFFALDIGESVSGQWMPQNRDENYDVEVILEKLRTTLIIYNIQLAAGRDQLIWGYGKRGNFLLSDNAGPYDFISLGSFRPFKFPWIFKYLGAWHMRGFASRIHGSRNDFTHPYLFGAKLNWAPWTWIEGSVARTIMALGEGRQGMDGGDWLDTLFGRNEHTYGGASDTNQLFETEIRLHMGFLKPWVDMGSLSAYWEFATESFSRDYAKTYVSANLVGMEYDSARWGLWGEWATTMTDEVAWYSHYVYTDGYTQEGKVMGHPMGPFARDYAIGGWLFAMPEFSIDFDASITSHESVREWVVKDRITRGSIGIETYFLDDITLRFEGEYGRTVYYKKADPTDDIRFNLYVRWALTR